jgi:hypothetical protein
VPTPRLVFDTHYYYTLSPPVLRELRRRGFVLSISMSAFVEAWARCRRDRKPARCGCKEGGCKPTSYLLAMARSWVAVSAEQEKRARTEERRRKLQERNRRNDRLLRDADPKRLWKAMWRYLINFHPLPGMQPPPAAERFNAYMRVMGGYLLRTGRGGSTASENDAQDVLQLQHVGEGAIFVTREQKILELVDRSGTFQAPWVRTLVEVLTERLPRGMPWGRHARRLRAMFRRLPYKELRDSEEVMLSRMRKAGLSIP